MKICENLNQLTPTLIFYVMLNKLHFNNRTKSLGFTKHLLKISRLLGVGLAGSLI